jgi:hypothetical protein
MWEICEIGANAESNADGESPSGEVRILPLMAWFKRV